MMLVEKEILIGEYIDQLYLDVDDSLINEFAMLCVYCENKAEIKALFKKVFKYRCTDLESEDLYWILKRNTFPKNSGKGLQEILDTPYIQ